LTAEIEAPNDGQLDAYLQPFIEAPIPRENWLKSVASLPGLDGVNALADAAAGYSDPAIAAAYRDFENRRGYHFEN
jgi:cell filamentation protein